MSDPSSHALSPRQRSSWRSLIEVIVSAGVGGYLIAIFLFITDGSPTWPVFWQQLKPFAMAAQTDAEWFLPTLLGVLVVIYGILVGRAIVAGSEEVETRFTNRLGRGAQGIAVIAIWHAVLTVVVATSGSERAAHTPVILVVSLVVVILGVSAGTFSFGTLRERHSAAKRAQASYQRAPFRSHLTEVRRPLRLIAVNAAVGAALPLAVAALAVIFGRLVGGWVTASLVFALLAVLTTVAVDVAVYTLLTSVGSRVNAVLSTIPLALAGQIFPLVAVLVGTDVGRLGVWLGWSVLLVDIGVWLLALLPLSRHVRNACPWMAGNGIAAKALNHIERRQRKYKRQAKQIKREMRRSEVASATP